jgi:hypothetical protein
MLSSSGSDSYWEMLALISLSEKETNENKQLALECLKGYGNKYMIPVFTRNTFEFLIGYYFFISNTYPFILRNKCSNTLHFA